MSLQGNLDQVVQTHKMETAAKLSMQKQKSLQTFSTGDILNISAFLWNMTIG